MNEKNQKRTIRKLDNSNEITNEDELSEDVFERFLEKCDRNDRNSMSLLEYKINNESDKKTIIYDELDNEYRDAVKNVTNTDIIIEKETVNQSLTTVIVEKTNQNQR